jgi:hypothetical protein
MRSAMTSLSATVGPYSLTCAFLCTALSELQKPRCEERCSSCPCVLQPIFAANLLICLFMGICHYQYVFRESSN